MKYAIIESGGKQYRVAEGSDVFVDLLPGEDGAKHRIDSVLLVSDGDKVSIGTPTVKGAYVDTTIKGMAPGEKIVVFHYRPKKRERVKTGHRQKYTCLKIEKIGME